MALLRIFEYASIWIIIFKYAYMFLLSNIVYFEWYNINFEIFAVQF